MPSIASGCVIQSGNGPVALAAGRAVEPTDRKKFTKPTKIATTARNGRMRCTYLIQEHIDLSIVPH
jgi:hypothetical protein